MIIKINYFSTNVEDNFNVINIIFRFNNFYSFYNKIDNST